jgi:hypothetical protein
MGTQVSQAEEQRKGEQLIKLLGLRVKPNGRVDTEWGDKTPLGLYRTVARFMTDEQKGGG